jgi:hypothetical protein
MQVKLPLFAERLIFIGLGCIIGGLMGYLTYLIVRGIIT